ncbi:MULTISPECIES: 50S ribosomal protein L3 [Mesoplasma]|uniref:Large ribosomal subunit protein uL3 n=1 Tax=Mesoplasma florum TaxID=2151 RepID=A0A2R3P4T3_MESFO|nr:50S ribosomal protein L3 [Mesoplasma florum]AVN63493.1 50S ribosomal protein L3 [Mesoplasma florum]AVN64179.1 50S ribosomal protein L3 [Mesoplasma florum]
MKGILGRKVEMTQVFTANGKLVPVTVVEVQPNTILQVKTLDTNGYVATQLGVFDKRENLVNKPELGQFKKANSVPKRFVKEIRNMEGFEVGSVISASDIFETGQYVDVTGISKGKGFAGAIKRHNYSRGPMAHGSGYHRGIGSMGAIINRIFKSKKMAGHMGHVKRTVQNLEVIAIDNNIMLVKGSIPGPNKGFVTIKANVKGLSNTQAAELLVRNAPVATEAPIEAPVVEEVVSTEE